jgi:type I restriction enzyme S subunit
MTNGWQKRRLGELCEIELGKTPARANASYWDEKRETNNVWLSIADLLKSEDGVVVDSKEYVSNKGAEICKRVPKGTLLVSFKLTLGRLAFAGRDLFTNEAIAALTIFNERELSKEFLFYFLHFFDWVGAAENDVKLKGMTLNKAKLKEICVYYPKALAEQRRIVGILDEAFAGLATATANAEKNLLSARAIFESYHQSIFSHCRNGWEKKALGDVCEYVNGKAHERCIDADGTFIVINSKFISSDGEVIKRSNQALLPMQPGDIAMVLSDVPNGKALAKCFLVDEANSYTLNQRICLIRSKCLHTKFLFYQINRNGHFLAFNNGENQTNLRLNQVLSCPLFLPPRAEQESIAARLDAMKEETQHLAKIFEQKLAALEALKRSLLHHAFTGQLK